MAITGLRGLLLPGPVAVPSRYGLLSVIRATNPGDPHWQAGVEWEDTLCAPASSTLPDCGFESPGIPAKTPESGPDFRKADPFTVIGSYDCSTGGRTAQSAFDIARARLLAWEEHEVEAIFWTGDTDAGAVVPSLSEGDTAAGITPTDITPVGGALDAPYAIGALEAAMATCVPGLGVIHIPAQAVASLKWHSLIERDSDIYRTPMGHAAVLGSGYPGTGPAGDVPAAGEAWIFGTGPMVAWQGEVFLTPELVAAAVDRTLNDITVYAERTYAVGFSCCLFATRVVLPGGDLS